MKYTFTAIAIDNYLKSSKKTPKINLVLSLNTTKYSFIATHNNKNLFFINYPL